jgi:rubrerythrin
MNDTGATMIGHKNGIWTCPYECGRTIVYCGCTYTKDQDYPVDSARRCHSKVNDPVLHSSRQRWIPYQLHDSSLELMYISKVKSLHDTANSMLTTPAKRDTVHKWTDEEAEYKYNHQATYDDLSPMLTCDTCGYSVYGPLCIGQAAGELSHY